MSNGADSVGVADQDDETRDDDMWGRGGAEARRARVGVRQLVAVTRGHRSTIAAAMGLTLCGGVLGLAQPLLATHTIGQFARRRPYLLPLGALVVVFVAEAVITAVGHYLLERAGEGIVRDLRWRIVDRLLRWPIRRHHQHRLGDLLTRATSDTTLLRDSLAYDLVEVSVGVFVVLGGIAMMIWLDATMFLIVAVIVGAIGGATLLLLRGIRSSVEEAQDSLGGMSADLERALSAIRTVRVLRAESRERDRVGQLVGAAYASSLQAAKRNAVIEPAMTLAVHGALITVLVVGGLRVASGAASLADLVGFLLYVSYVATPMANLFDVLATLQRGLAALQRLEDVIQIPTEDEEETEADKRRVQQGMPTVARAPVLGNAAPADAPAIEFRNVGFAYTPDRPVLRDVSFSVPRNSHTALVGPSGAGKSTIFALIARFHDPQTGHILLDGRDIGSEMTIQQTRATLGLVEQSAPVMRGTLRENIAYARPDATDAEIARAVELASLRSLVNRLPQGLRTPVGEHGSTLSGGERQRVAIARALLPRPRLLLLDEPTSHLDAANETALARAIERVSAECTLLVIAHRPSTIRAADQIIVLDHGRIRATGAYPNVAHLIDDRRPR